MLLELKHRKKPSKTQEQEFVESDKRAKHWCNKCAQDTKHRIRMVGKKKSKKYYCISCDNKRKIKKRQSRAKVRQEEKEERNGCEICGKFTHSECFTFEELTFHHLDPKQKLQDVTADWYDLEHMRIEMAKCICVCTACHTQIEAGTRRIPIEVLMRAVARMEYFCPHLLPDFEPFGLDLDGPITIDFVPHPNALPPMSEKLIERYKKKR